MCTVTVAFVPIFDYYLYRSVLYWTHVRCSRQCSLCLYNRGTFKGSLALILRVSIHDRWADVVDIRFSLLVWSDDMAQDGLDQYRWDDFSDIIPNIHA